MALKRGKTDVKKDPALKVSAAVKQKAHILSQPVERVPPLSVYIAAVLQSDKGEQSFHNRSQMVLQQLLVVSP